jgi:hypothetical protein
MRPDILTIPFQTKPNLYPAAVPHIEVYLGVEIRREMAACVLFAHFLTVTVPGEFSYDFRQ